MKKFNRDKAKQLADKIIEAEAALSRYLNECFPAGTRCGVLLMHGQKTPTPAQIVGSRPNRYGGEVNVSIDTAKQNSRQRFRSIPAIDVITGSN